MQRSLGLVQVDEIYITHYHADHYLGLPGLLKTYDLQDRQPPLRVLGPPGPAGPVRRPAADLRPDPLRDRAGRARARGGRARTRATRSAPSRSSTGWRPTATRSSRRSGRAASTPSGASGSGVADGRDFGRLQRGEEVRGRRRCRRARAGDGRGARRAKGRDHRRHRALRETRIAAHDAELLVHDGTLRRRGGRARRRDRPLDRPGRPRALAGEAEAKMLALVHVSSRYNVGAVLDEAREDFPATRGAARLRPGRDPLPRARRAAADRDGARERRDERALPVEPTD